MPRLLFEKTGNAIWISHLDLMRLFQRAFKRAGLPLTHTLGFNPRPSVSIALPLSVGVESVCELLDFDLDNNDATCDQILDLLNKTLVEGIRVQCVYSDGRKVRDLALLHSCITLEYDRGVPQGAVEAIEQLFRQDTVIVPKKTKNGVQDQNIVSMIRELSVSQVDDHTVVISVLACCQNPTLNPMQLIAAIHLHASAFEPDFAKCRRMEIYDAQEKVFR